MELADPAAHNPLMDSNISDAVLIHTDAHLRLTSAELSRAGGQDAVALSDVVGAQAVEGSDVVEVFSYVRQGRCNSAPQRTFRPRRYRVGDAAAARAWASGLRHVLRRIHDCASTAQFEELRQRAFEVSADGTRPDYPSRRLLVFINPVSGAGEAEAIFRSQCAPVLRHAGCALDVVVTTRQAEATERARTLDVEGIDGIVSVGGDGLLAEICEGLCSRDDAEKVLQIPLGVLPGGSGNALCTSIAYNAGEKANDTSVGARNAAFLIAKGRIRPLDMAIAWQGVQPLAASSGSAASKSTDAAEPSNENDASTDTATTAVGFGRRPSFLSLEWGMIADIDLESERWRCCGGARFVFGTLERIACLRRYHGAISYLPCPDKAVVTTANTNDVDKGSTAAYDRSGFFAPSGSGTLPPLSEPLPAEWVRIEGEFSFIWVCNTSHMSEDSHPAPGAQLSDGLFHIFIVRRANRRQLLPIFLGLEQGGHVAREDVDLIKTRAYRLEPGEGSRGLQALDGELVPTMPMQSEIFQGVARVFG